MRARPLVVTRVGTVCERADVSRCEQGAAPPSPSPSPSDASSFIPPCSRKDTGSNTTDERVWAEEQWLWVCCLGVRSPQRVCASRRRGDTGVQGRPAPESGLGCQLREHSPASGSAVGPGSRYCPLGRSSGGRTWGSRVRETPGEAGQLQTVQESAGRDLFNHLSVITHSIQVSGTTRVL